ncbi:MAG: nicotinamidase/pyrazinamidase [Armatimonadetes bacterium CG_4_10_14_3_um_filter_66_18]|nr:bifunctional nicotinamidase/pyrazinamidase [Armatimonadota bacterium]OIP05671.1 MAG: nicotinamidase [Armatimonadetes bacterium CG2_30_66_41]PIU91605.1 MAG: nicotinamidase/pyrazinamidase [Armatimonadetes bacterium CG06_land_8_20_14_3_00_66_21]PIX46496.1 MAG: nicotinamidase/pyrazinamidase [Armatimonadetes bacterium CG_4_8_14_3_um_filter_66_20]PIY37766.1 MAG: nicotinamidase/pyrazinamidase [Armatimonadetes bacterium CG_4_10_14_3_um_filter_66_18]PIZ38307.1 MAG: nicotinamidase/pyrazinamidase [Arm
MNALLLVDLQNDFLPGGALAVPEGDQVVPVANELMDRFDLVIATQDWHPAGHGSFASQHPGGSVGDLIELNGLQQILWPDHCVEGSPGADFAPGFLRDRVNKVIHKGTDAGIDSYSALFDNGHRKATGLDEYLKERGVDQLYMLGLATDYCVKFTALDARQLGLQVHLIEDGCRGVNLSPGDSDAALAELREAGCRIVRSDNVDGR